MGTTEKGNNNASLARYDDDKWTDFIWNGKTGQLFGRTGLSWVKITVFYIIFYAALASFAWLCYYMFAKWTLVDDKPRWILDSSIIGTNPGVGFRPMPNQDETSGSSLIWYKRGNDSDAAMWYKQLTHYTEAIENPRVVDGLQVCSYANGNKATASKSCRVDIKDFDMKCSKKTKFGYSAGEPCFLIKLNRIYGWKPEPIGLDQGGTYNAALLEQFLSNVKDDMSNDVKKHISEIARTDPAQLNTVWISCQGEDVADKENLGNVAYYPSPGIPGYYFPYLKQPSYQSPFVFIQLSNPKSGVIINVECRAWANNIIYNKMDRLGSVHFEVLID